MVAGRVYAIAGNGQYGVTVEGALATATPLPVSGTTLTQDPAGNVLFTDRFGGRVWAVAATSGFFYGRQMTAGHLYSIVAGPGIRQPGIRADVCHGGISQVIVDRPGNLVINCGFAGLLVLALRSGTFYGEPMHAGTLERLHPAGWHWTRALWAESLALDRFGNLLLLDQTKVIVLAGAAGSFYGQKMRPGAVYSIDPRPALAFATDQSGNVLVIDRNYEHPRIEVIAGRSGPYYGRSMTAGHLYPLAGSGVRGYLGDGGPAASAELNSPGEIAFWPGHGVLVNDDSRIRLIYPPGQ